MTRLHTVLIGGLTTLLVTGCMNSEKAGNNNQQSGCLPLEVNSTVPTTTKPPVIRMAKIEGNCLHAEVIYSACEEIEWQLYWDQKMRKSYPAQVSLFLVTKDSSRCGTQHVVDLYYDLRTFSETAFGDQVWINLKGYDYRIKWQAKKEN